MSDLYALLIGVDFYFPNQLPEGGSYRHLAGCVRDIAHMEAFLKSRLKLPDEHITKLTATNTGQGQPAEPATAWPTYANMVAAFRQVTDQAQPGDRVYVHYSGHGGRTTTAYSELKSDGLDEGLAPTDIGDAHARYLRDVEIHYLLQEMVEKKLVLTVVLDSCHSGGATRAVNGQILGASPRGIPGVDTTSRPLDSLVADRPSLVAAWAGQSTRQSRAAKAVNGWLLEPKGYTLLAACRASEFAYEYPFNGKENNGALTYWLLDTLRQAGPAFTYKMLGDRILAKVHGQFDQQTPMLQGEGDVMVFGAERIQPFYAVSVLKTEGDRVRLNAGEAHGLSLGAQLSVYPPFTTDFGDVANRIAQVEVTSVQAVEAWADVINPPAAAPIEPGAQAVLESMANVNFQRNIALDIPDATLRAQMEAAILAQGKGFARLAAADEPVHFVVELTSTGEFSIQDAADRPISNLRPAIRVADDKAVDRVVARLVHLARFQGVRDLSMTDAVAAQKLKVELIGSSACRPGDRVGLRITNTQAPDSDSRILNVTVLALSSDWSIAQIYPSGSGNFQSVSPQETIDLRFQTYLPEGQTLSTDIFKVFATQGTTNFRWLELPALDQPLLNRSITRGTTMDPLERLLASVTDDADATRAIRLVGSSEDKAWTVAQVELRVDSDPVYWAAATEVAMLNALPLRADLPLLDRTFTPEEYELLKLGYNAHDMDSKWGILFKDGWLSFYRTWGAILIFLLHLTEEEQGVRVDQAYASRDTNMYTGTDTEEEVRLVTFLIDRLLLDRPDSVLRNADGSPVGGLLLHHKVGRV